MLKVQNDFANGLKIRSDNGPTSNQQLVPSFSDRGTSYDLSQTTPDPVSVHCLCGDSLAYHKPETRVFKVVGDSTEYEKWMGSGSAALTEGKKVALATEPLVLVQKLTQCFAATSHTQR